MGINSDGGEKMKFNMQYVNYAISSVLLTTFSYLFLQCINPNNVVKLYLNDTNKVNDGYARIILAVLTGGTTLALFNDNVDRCTDIFNSEKH